MMKNAIDVHFTNLEGIDPKEWDSCVTASEEGTFFHKFNRYGETLYAAGEEIIDAREENGTLTNLKKQLLFHCPRCGQSLELYQVRSNCPICGGICCDFCHEQQLKFERENFERQIIIEQERLRWLESKIFDRFPFIRIIRQVNGINSIRRLENVRRRLIER